MMTFKKAVSKIVIAFSFSLIILLVLYIIAGKQINSVISIVNMISVDEKITDNSKLTINKDKKRLNLYPSYGTVFGDLHIESIKLKLPIYHGDDASILKSGVGHYAGSYFPGEGSFIIMAGHATKDIFYNLISVKVWDIINIHTTYGDYVYKVYQTKIIKETDENSLFVEDNGEVLILYTCYPRNALVGHAKHRFVVYAKVVE